MRFFVVEDDPDVGFLICEVEYLGPDVADLDLVGELADGYPDAIYFCVEPDNRSICPIDGERFDLTKDFFITINERKGPSVNLCSLHCATAYYTKD